MTERVKYFWFMGLTEQKEAKDKEKYVAMYAATKEKNENNVNFFSLLFKNTFRRKDMRLERWFMVVSDIP